MIGGIVSLIFGVVFVGAAIWMWVQPSEWSARLQGFPIPVWLGGILAMIVGIGLGVWGGMTLAG